MGNNTTTATLSATTHITSIRLRKQRNSVLTTHLRTWSTRLSISLMSSLEETTAICLSLSDTGPHPGGQSRTAKTDRFLNLGVGTTCPTPFSPWLILASWNKVLVRRPRLNRWIGKNGETNWILRSKEHSYQSRPKSRRLSLDLEGCRNPYTSHVRFGPTFIA